MEKRKRCAFAIFLILLAASAAPQPGGSATAPVLDEAVALYARGSFSEAFDLLNEVSLRADEKTLGDIADRLVMMGLSEYYRKNYKNAYEALRVAIKLSPANYTGTQYYVRIRREMDVNALGNAEAPAAAPPSSPAKAAEGTKEEPAAAPSVAPSGASAETDPTFIPRLEALLQRIEADQAKMGAQASGAAGEAESRRMISLLGEIAERQKDSEKAAQDGAIAARQKGEIDDFLARLDERLEKIPKPFPAWAVLVGLAVFFCLIAAAFLIALIAKTRNGAKPEGTRFFPNTNGDFSEIMWSSPSLLSIPSGRLESIRGRIDAATLAQIVMGLRTVLCGRDRSAITAKLSREIAKALGLSAEEQESAFLAALAHDAGYLMLDAAKLREALGQRKIGAADFSFIKSHAVMGPEYFKGAELPGILSDALLYHHERMDGSGYPEGLSGEAIPLVARIIGAAESFVALLSERSYRKRCTLSEAAEVVRSGEGSQYDLQIVAALIKVVDRVAEAQGSNGKTGAARRAPMLGGGAPI